MTLKSNEKTLTYHEIAPENGAAVDRRGFLGGVLKLGAGAAALSVLAACEALEPADPLAGRGGGSCGGRRKRHRNQDDKRVASPRELFEPMTMGMVMEDKWKLGKIARQPDSHLRVELVDVSTGNPLEIEIFRAVAGNAKAIAETDHWEFYTYDGETAGQTTPDHVKDAINQLAMRILDNESKAPIVNLNKTVCTFAQRKHETAPTADTPQLSRAGS